MCRCTNEKEFLKTIDDGLELESNETWDLICNYEVERINGDDHRWQREVTSIIKLEDRYFSIDWMEALTECQENDYWNQPIEVEPYEETIIVKKWRTKDE